MLSKVYTGIPWSRVAFMKLRVGLMETIELIYCPVSKWRRPLWWLSLNFHSVMYNRDVALLISVAVMFVIYFAW